MPCRSVFASTFASTLAATATIGAAVSAASPVLAGDGTVDLLTLDATRTHLCEAASGTLLDFNFATGNMFTLARTSIADPANFGPGGTVPRSIELVAPVACFTDAALDGMELVVLTTSAQGLESPGLAPCELLALDRFVRAGGSLVVIENAGTRRTASITGADSEAPGGSGPAVIEDPTSPVIAGPFGTVTGPFSLAFHRVCEDVGPNGSVFLASSGAVGVMFTVGAGQVAVFNDEEWITSVGGSPCAALQQPEPQRLAMYLNFIAAALPTTDFDYVAASPAGDVDCSGLVDFSDVIAVLAAWGPCPEAGDPPLPVACPACPGDVDENGTIGFNDLITVLSSFGDSV